MTTKDQIIALAKQAGIPFNKYGLVGCNTCETDIDDALEAFHRLALDAYRTELLAEAGVTIHSTTQEARLERFARAIEAAVLERLTKVDVGGKNCIKCGERLMSDLTKTCYACDHAETKVDVEPCCTNWKAGTNCFADPQPNCPHLKVDVEPVKLSHSEDFCYCDHEISLQIVSGGAAPEGLYGRVTLQVKGEYVDYVPDSTLASLQAENERLQAQLDNATKWIDATGTGVVRDELRAENERLKQEIQNQYKCIESHAKITQAAQAENERLREALEKTTFELEVCDQSDYGRKWLWPETAHASAMKNVREAIDAARTALEAKHD